MKYKGIVFDFNGVILWDDPWHEEAWIRVSEMLRGQPMSVEEMRQNIWGGNNRNAFRYVLGKDVSAEQLLELIEHKEKLYREIAITKPDFVLSPGAEDLFDLLLKNRIPRAIATSSEINNVNFFIEKLNLEKWFDRGNIVYDDGTVPSKPSPEIFLRAAKKLGLDPAVCLVVEDSSRGLEAAHNAGFGKIFHLSHGHQKAPVDVHRVIKTLNEITLADFE